MKYILEYKKFDNLTIEEQEIKDKAISDNTFMKAPNGRKTKLTEKQWLQVRTKNFINWFGDWLNEPDNASKVVDENGEPKVVYHGTGTNITIFDKKIANDLEGRTIGVGTGKGVFSFTNDKDNAQYWANRSKERSKYGVKSDNPNIIEVFLRIKNPIDRDVFISMLVNKSKGYTFVPMKTRDKFITDIYNELKKKKVDGVISGYGEYNVFYPIQIKSATDNNGDFNPTNKNITK